MTNGDIAKLLTDSERKFQRCWNVLESMKQFKIDIIEFPHFQPVLAEAIYDLSIGYKKICKVRKELISKKTEYSLEWFANRQKLLAGQQNALNAAISIGKAMGDAFAWFFYQTNQELLLEHAKHPLIKHMPTGIGGIGEREFIKNTRRVGPFMVLYHGTTSILRIGDITLIDLRKFKVAAIGELKTCQPESGKLEILLQFVGLNKNLEPFLQNKLFIHPSHKTARRLPSSFQARLEKQINNITKTIVGNKERKGGVLIDTHERRHVPEFEKAISSAEVNQFTYARLGRGLLCTIYRQRHRSLHSSLVSTNVVDFHAKADGLDQNVLSLMRKNSPHNRIIKSPFLYSRDGDASFLPGTIPVFWWPISLEILKELIFQDCIVINIYNPAHLLHDLEAKEYKITIERNRKLRLSKKIGKGNMEIQGLPYFLRLIHRDMFEEGQILEMIESLEDTVKNKQGHGSMKIDISIDHVNQTFAELADQTL